MSSRLTDNIHKAQKELMESGIYGCMTGSSLLDCDFDTWDEQPDIDVFAYTEYALIQALDIMRFKYGYVPATKGEEWKCNRLIKYGMQKNFALSTVKFKTPEDIIINISYKKGKNSVLNVLSSFDMTIVMQGVDLETRTFTDLRGENTHVAKPNPHRCQDFDAYVVSQWIRQFDRVIKYHKRGFDTTPMAKFYLDAIDIVLETGNLFTTEKSKEYYDAITIEFEEVKAKIKAWLTEVDDTFEAEQEEVIK